jgi:branched-chain amino acid aminotransferase
MPASYIQANTNGRLHSAAEPSLSPLNRGYLYGDAIYEVWRTFDRTMFAWEEHFARLEQSARSLYLELPWSRAEILAEIKRTVVAFRDATGFRGELYIRLQVARGAGAIGLDTALADRAEFVLLVQPCPINSPEILARGITLSIATTLRRNPIESLSPAWKTGNYLNNILGLREARARGADDVVMLNLSGEITEAATSNIAFVRDGEVLTPPLAAGILEGITRGLLLRKIAPAVGIRVHEVALTPKDLGEMTECFLLGTTRDVLPVGAIDQKRFSVGPDTVSTRLKAGFSTYGHASAAEHPELNVG